jgi:DNA-binding NarL/FixJ family response regulator
MLLDLHIPNIDGFSILESVNKAYSTIPIAILSASSRQEDVGKVMATSAMAYIHKNASSKVMLGAIRLMLTGGLYTPPATALLGYAQEGNGEGHLTARQIEVLTLLVSGGSNKQIAAKLGIAEATIKMHITSIFKSLRVQSRTQAALVG